MSTTALDWHHILDGKLPWAELVVCSESEIDDFVRDLPAGAVVRTIRGKRCTTLQSLFQEWAAAFQFPYYFGENWDAFEECLCDLDWLPAESYLVVVTEVEKTLARLDKQFHTLMDILASVSAHWKSESTSPRAGFRVLFHTNPNAEGMARQRLEKAGMHSP